MSKLYWKAENFFSGTCFLNVCCVLRAYPSGQNRKKKTVWRSALLKIQWRKP